MIIAPGIIILLLVVLSFAGLLVWLTWRFSGPIGRLMACLALLALAYFGFRAFHTTDRDLMKEFSSKTGLALPSSARLVQRSVDGHPFWSDYSCEGIITVDPKDFAAFAERLKARKKRSEVNTPDVSDRLKQMFGHPFEVAEWECIPGEGVDRFCWGLLKDGRTIFFSSLET